MARMYAHLGNNVDFTDVPRGWRSSRCAASLAIGLLGPATSASAAAVCSTSLQALVDATPTGGVLRLPACIYEQRITINKPMTLDGQGQAEIRGSDVWSTWAQSGGAWISANTLPPFDAGGGVICDDPRCNWPEQVFYDGTPLTQVAAGTCPELWPVLAHGSPPGRTGQQPGRACRRGQYAHGLDRHAVGQCDHPGFDHAPCR